MLHGLTKLVRRNAFVIVGIWVATAIVVWVPAPRIPALLKEDSNGFLPADLPSQRAFQLLREEFPDAAPASRLAVVAARDVGLAEADREHLRDVAVRLSARSQEKGWRVHAAGLSPQLRTLLESPDGRSALVAVDLPAPMLTPHTVARVREVQTILGEVRLHLPPVPGLQIELTGDAALGELLDANARRDIDRTTWWVFGGVVAILLLIYRSPVAMFVPILTIAAALMVSLGLIGWGASRGLQVNGVVEMFTVMIVAGCGVDYCLFLFARFREEVSNGCGIAEGVERALECAGRPVLASAATNLLGLAVLVLGRNRDLSTSGPVIAFALFVATLAVMTLTPAIMWLVGPRLFWPIPVRRAARDGAFWRWMGHTAAARPLLVATVVLAFLTPFAIVGARVQPLYDALEEYPADSSFVRGARLYYEHFHDGNEASEPSLIVRTDRTLRSVEGRAALTDAMDEVARILSATFPLAYVRDFSDPLGSRRTAAAGETVGAFQTIIGGLAQNFGGDFYLGRSAMTARIDVGLRMPPRSVPAMDMLSRLASTVETVVRDRLSSRLGVTSVEVLIAGETATYADIRAVQRRDFELIAIVATLLIFGVLIVLVRSVVQSLMLIAATLVAYLATYGATAIVFDRVLGLPGLSYQVQFLLFIIMLSLGQDYNIFVVSRVREEMRTRPLRSAVAFAVHRTGVVVSGCGLIMASAFASLFAGSLTVLKEFAFALSAGILIDTFVIRPLLVPSLILLLSRSSVPRYRRVSVFEPTGTPIAESAAAS